MQTFLSKNYILLALLFLAQTIQPLSAKNMYRWIDENGNVYYSDQIPPNQAKHRRESLNKDAQIVDVVEKEKTKAQRELQLRLEKLRLKQEEIIAKHKAYDNVLLTTYRDLADIKQSLAGKVSSLRGQRLILDGNLNRIELQLKQQQQKAAQYERDGNKIPPRLLSSISDSKKQVEVVLEEIRRQTIIQNKIVSKFNEDIARFSFLTQSKMTSNTVSSISAQNKAANELGLFICDIETNCSKAWESARNFLVKYSMTPLEFVTEKLIMSQPPLKDTAISLSVSKMRKGRYKQQFFLDIRCRDSDQGDLLCAGEQAKNIRQLFNSFIKSSLTN